MIEAMQARNPDLHEAIVDAYETRMMEVAPKAAE
jgi:hypothetical protein